MVNEQSLVAEYRRCFDGAEPSVLVRAPGRVNLIGEHIDYNGGLVMPAAIHLATFVAAGRRTDARVVARSATQPASVTIDLSGAGAPLEGWGAYVQGVCAELRLAGAELTGASLLIMSDVPPGGGLSSSAALEAGVALALLHLSGVALPRELVARACRAAEHRYARVPCGIMDQLACLCARERSVLLIDCARESLSWVPWPRDTLRLVIVDSQTAHQLAQGEYARRVEACRQARQVLSARVPRGTSMPLCAFSLDDLSAAADELPPLLFRRARHAITENLRVRAAAEALAAGRFDRLGALMDESHRSLAEDYEVSTPRMDHLAAIVRGIPGVFGARMTGGGFGGCVVAIAEAPALPAIEASVRSGYDSEYGVQARIWTTAPGDGASVHVRG